MSASHRTSHLASRPESRPASRSAPPPAPSRASSSASPGKSPEKAQGEPLQHYPSSLYEPSKRLVNYFSHRGLAIRQDDGADIKRVQKLMFSIFDEFGMNGVKRYYENHRDALAKEYYGGELGRRMGLVANDAGDPEGDIAGSAFLIRKPERSEPDTGEISKMYLLPDYRGKGLGKRMLQELIAKAPAFGFDKLYLSSRTEWNDALALYKHLGFTFVPNKRFPGIAACVAMELKLK